MAAAVSTVSSHRTVTADGARTPVYLRSSPAHGIPGAGGTPGNTVTQRDGGQTWGRGSDLGTESIRRQQNAAKHSRRRNRHSHAGPVDVITGHHVTGVTHGEHVTGRNNKIQPASPPRDKVLKSVSRVRTAEKQRPKVRDTITAACRRGCRLSLDISRIIFSLSLRQSFAGSQLNQS